MTHNGSKFMTHDGSKLLRWKHVPGQYCQRIERLNPRLRMILHPSHLHEVAWTIGMQGRMIPGVPEHLEQQLVWSLAVCTSLSIALMFCSAQNIHEFEHVIGGACNQRYHNATSIDFIENPHAFMTLAHKKEEIGPYLAVFGNSDNVPYFATNLIR